MSKITFQEINKLALPAILAGIAEPLMSLVDTAFVGSLSTNELAGVGIGASVYTLVVWVLAQMKSAISAIVSRNLGEDKLHTIENLIPQSILLNIVSGVVFYVLICFLQEPIFEFYGAKGEVYTHCTNYFNIRGLAFPLSLATFGIFGIFRGLQNTKWAMYICLLGGSINLVLDFLLIHGINGYIPSLGVEGAAWASVFAQFIMLLLALYTLRKMTIFENLSLGSLNPEFKTLVILSANLFARTGALNVAYFLGTKFATSYGEVHVAAHTIAMNIWLFSAFFIDGYANAGNAISGKLLGSNDKSLIWHLGNDITKYCLVIGIGLGLCYFISYNFIGTIFSPDQLVIDQFELIFWLVIITQPINGLAFGLDGIYKGLGEAAFLRNVLASGTCLVFIPILFALDYLGLQLSAVWIAFAAWMLWRGMALYIKFRSDFRLR